MASNIDDYLSYLFYSQSFIENIVQPGNGGEAARGEGGGSTWSG